MDARRGRDARRGAPIEGARRGRGRTGDDDERHVRRRGQTVPSDEPAVDALVDAVDAVLLHRGAAWCRAEIVRRVDGDRWTTNGGARGENDGRLFGIQNHSAARRPSERDDARLTNGFRSHAQMEQMAKDIAAIDHNVELGEIQWRTFADGFPNIFVNNAEQVHGRHVAFLASFHNASVIFQQLSVIYSLPKMFVASFRLILPFFPTGTFERVDKEGEIPTAVTMARMLSNIPHSRGGPTDMIVFDIHALQERFYFGDSVTPLFCSGIPLLLAKLDRLQDAADVVIAYPDEGACKRFHNFFSKYDEVVCTKVREGDKRIVTIKEGKPMGKHIVIVDDLVQSGGTLIECAKVLRREGASAVSAYVTHGVFPNESWRRFTDPAAGFANFWITDSCPQTVSACSGVAPFDVLKLAGSIAHALNI